MVSDLARESVEVKLHFVVDLTECFCLTLWAAALQTNVLKLQSAIVTQMVLVQVILVPYLEIINI